MQHNPARQAERPDLGNQSLLLLLAATIGAAAIVVWVMRDTRPGDPPAQFAAAVGTLLLLVPAAFSFSKRRAKRVNTPQWFVAHVICSNLGLLFISVHIAGGSITTPAILILLALLFLVIQGTFARAFLGPKLAQLFAGSPTSFNFGQAPKIDRSLLAQIIERKQTLLKQLNPAASEATFSPTLSDWISHPVKAWRYQLLTREESAIVGARNRAGPLLQYWRAAHLIVAALFAIGLFVHVVIMIFFAGYAAGASDPYWWHLTAWGD